MDIHWALLLEQKDRSEIFKRYTSNDLFDMSSMLNEYMCVYKYA